MNRDEEYCFQGGCLIPYSR